MWPSNLEVSALLPVHRAALGLHLLALSADDRYARFGMALNDDAVLRWVAGIDWQTQRWWGAWLPGDMGVIAALQFTPTTTSGTWELAMTVSMAARRQGLARLLFAAAMGQMQDVRALVGHHGHPALARIAGAHFSPAFRFA